MRHDSPTTTAFCRGIRHLTLVPIVLAMAICSASSFAQAVTVTTVNDIVDFPAPQQVGNLPGPDGVISFREAVLAANNTPGPQTIEFAIPQSDWWLVSNMAVLRLESTPFVLTDAETTVDFTTQTDFTGDTNPNGWEVGVYGLQPNAMGVTAILVNGNNCVIKGLSKIWQRGYGVELRGDNNRVIACTITGPLYAGVKIQGSVGNPAENNIIGGTEPGEGNILSAGNSGVRIDGPAENNIVIGNTLSGSFFGVEIRTATCCPGYVASNNRVGGPTPAERNFIFGAGKYGEEGFPVGGQVAVQYSPNNIIEGNYIGVRSDGVTIPAVQRGPVGVEVRTSAQTIVRNNLIGGILVVGVNHHAGERFGDAIRVMGDCEGALIEGNQIGIAADNSTPIVNRAGLVAKYWSIDGTPIVPGPILVQHNLIANSETTGVRVEGQITRVHLTANSIFNNGEIGIDLLTLPGGGTGVSPNDPGDADTGGNQLQNFPVITAAETDGSSTHVQGTLNSTPNAVFTLEFFANVQCDPSNHGEGQSFLGSIEIATDANGDASFDATLPAAAPVDSFLTATAADIVGNTSEFSACQIVTGSKTRAADINQDGVVNVTDLLIVINAWGPCPPSPDPCLADIVPADGDLVVNVSDLLQVISDWG